MTVLTMPEREQVGANNPPANLELAKDEYAALSRFLADHPTIADENQAREAKGFVDRTRATLGTLDDERTAKVKPLNDEVGRINETYKKITGPLKRVYDELRQRLTNFAQAEEDKRLAKAEALRRQAELADMQARVAEQGVREIKTNATFGEIADVGAAIMGADQVANQAARIGREADRAERDTHVRIGGGFSGRALSMRSQEILILDDAHKALDAIGVTEKIREAILSSARDYRKLNGTLPVGVSRSTARKV